MWHLGNILSLTTFGESHGEAIGGILSGFPSGIVVDLDLVQQELQRRKPAQSKLVTQRKEEDRVRILSGLFEGKSTGMPIGFLIENADAKSKDYHQLAGLFRPSHADFTYFKKYGFRDHRGGGRSSARETANWVVAGALARQLLPKIECTAYVSAVGKIQCHSDYHQLNFNEIEKNAVRCPDPALAEEMEKEILRVKKAGDTVGGVVSCVIKGIPIGWGEPVFGKLHALLGGAMLSINAAKGFEYGAGFAGAQGYGSDLNDVYNDDAQLISNHSGGVQGGISNGMDLYFRVAFKPVATLMKEQKTIDNQGNVLQFKGKGRHDPCVVPRAVPIVENLAMLVLADLMLLQKRNHRDD